MPSPTHESLIRSYADAFNCGDLEGLCALFDPSAQIYGVLGWGGLDKAKPIWQMLMTSFKINLEIAGLISEEDAMAVRFIERGLFAAPFRDIQPTGKTYQVLAMEWFELQGDRFIRRWGARDSAAIYRQLGIPL